MAGPSAVVQRQVNFHSLPEEKSLKTRWQRCCEVDEAKVTIITTITVMMMIVKIILAMVRTAKEEKMENSIARRR